MATHPRSSRGGAAPVPHWAGLDDAALLQLRFHDLRLRVGDSLVQPEVRQLYGELESRGIRFKPHVWLSTEWFSPDDVPGIAVPFFVAHPRLCRLERRMMGEVEGGTKHWRLRILRHEAGHALDTAYGLHLRSDWRAVFGDASEPYPEHYSVQPRSRDHVLHIGYWYAQSHPSEDFAETFAVWMQPKAHWRRQYAGWPALSKLEYVDELMAEILRSTPRNRNRSVVASLAGNRESLGEHYRRRRRQDLAIERRYDPWLREVFASRASHPRAAPAARFIRTIEPRLKRSLVRRTGANPYLVDHVISTIMRRVGELNLVLGSTRRESVPQIVGLHERIVREVLERNREQFLL